MSTKKQKSKEEASYREFEKHADMMAEEKVKNEAMFASLGEGIITTDQDGVITMVSQATEGILGWSRDEIMGKPVIEVLNLMVQDGQDWKEVPIMKRPTVLALSTGEKTEIPVASHYYCLNKDKEKFPIGIIVTPFILAGKIIGTVLVFRDVSMESEVDRMKTEFVSIASHQLKTPLTSINWYVEMMMDEDVGKLNSDQKKYLDEVFLASKRMVKLVDGLLNVSRLESGRLRIDPKPLKLNPFIKDIINEAKPLAKADKIELVFKETKKLPEAMVDEALLRQVIHNLIVNAIRYSVVPKRKCKIEVVIKLDKKGFCIQVIDNGPGIEKVAQKRIFEKFFRSEAARQTQASGSGLGLYIAKMVMESSGGDLWFDSKVGKGTTFNVCIPLRGMTVKAGEKGLS